VDPRIAWALEQMQRRLAEPLSVPRLAHAVNLSVSRFAHLFRDQIGVSPRRYLHSLRMHRARILLQRTFLSVKEIMGQVGLSDPSHFSREFRRHHGESPLQLRRKIAVLQDPPTDSQTRTRIPRPPQTTTRIVVRRQRPSGNNVRR
jgi:AraC family transcriptional regulator of arabinose operon